MIFLRADTASFISKDEGCNSIYTYQNEDRQLLQRMGSMSFATKISNAIDDDNFMLYCQPIQSLHDDESQLQVEILLRMKGENDEIIRPSQFLPVAENSNLMSDIDTWVFERACYLLQQNSHSLEKLHQCTINLSAQSLLDEDFNDVIISTLREFNIPPEKICFEFSEATAIGNLRHTLEFIESLHKFGFSFSLDNFGSGISSFSYLKQLPVDTIKIDGSLVKNIVSNPVDFTMVNFIHDIGKSLGRKTTACFVENNKIMDKLERIGVDYVQGYAVGKPMPFAKFLRGEGV